MPGLHLLRVDPMVSLKRPDLSRVDPEILAYIIALENELNLRSKRESKEGFQKEKVVDIGFDSAEAEVLEPSEQPSSLNLVTVSQNEIIKRTPRHLYLRQRRGGMGIFDLDIHSDDFPTFLSIADEAQSLLVFTNFARVFRLPVNKLKSYEIRDRGEALQERIPFEPDEHVAAILPDQASGYVALISQTGVVRCLRHHLFGEYLKPGTTLFNSKETGPLAAACWTPGDADLFITTRNGIAIRFAEKLIPPRGDLGIRPAAGDIVSSITSVNDSSSVFLLSADGKGTLRTMSGFNPNKSAGGGGKMALKTSKLVAAFAVDLADDIFIISRLGKLIRFRADEVPPTEGVVQGVICINLRSDDATAAVKSIPQKTY